jgi:FAD/FMN-containing dehydrogenase
MSSDSPGPEHVATATLGRSRIRPLVAQHVIDPDIPGPPSPKALDALAAEVQGSVIVPDDPAYAAAHLVWNRDRQRRPAVIVACRTPEDVVATIGFARTVGLPLAVRGGGYTPSGTATCDGGVVLDTRPMSSVSVDRANGTVTVAAGATWGDVDPATQEHGLIVPGLPVSGVGVAGSTIGGGYGHLRRAYGLACDNLVRAELVTADGTRLTTSGDQNSELLWGLRGGGGNFGVVTSLTFRLRPLPGPVMSGAFLYPADRAGPLLRFYRDYTARLREDVTTRFSFVGAPHSALMAQTLGLIPTVRVIAITVVCVGHPIEAEALVRPLREAAPLLADLVKARPYAVIQSGPNAAYPAGARADVVSEYLPALDEDVVSALCEQYTQMPPGSCEMHIDHMGGAVGRVAQMSTAAPNRGAPYLFGAMARWSDRMDGRPHRTWLAATRTRLQERSLGGPHIGMDCGNVASEQAYGRDRYLRLAALKTRYDPDNVFARNLNVAPLA